MTHDIEIDRHKEYERLADECSQCSYEELLQKVQDGELSFLDFLIFQEDLFSLYHNYIVANGLKMTEQSASDWLTEYEKENMRF